MFAGDGGSNCLTLQIAGPDLVWSVGHDLFGMQNPLVYQATEEVSSNASLLGGFGHRQPLAILIGGTIGMNAVLVAQST